MRSSRRPPAAADSLESLQRRQTLAYFADESRIDELVAELSPKYHAENFALRNVKLVSMSEGRALPNQKVVVANGKIAQVGPASAVEVPRGMRIIDGKGNYLVPGLADMHVHEFI